MVIVFLAQSFFRASVAIADVVRNKMCQTSCRVFHREKSEKTTRRGEVVIEFFIQSCFRCSVALAAVIRKI